MWSGTPGPGKGAPAPRPEPFVSSGIGWWDHQMQGTLPEGRVARLLLDASGAEAGLQNVRYVWFTAHLPGVQLMVSWILDVNEPLTPGASFLFKNASTVALYRGPESPTRVDFGALPEASVSGTLTGVKGTPGESAEVPLPSGVVHVQLPHPELQSAGWPAGFTLDLTPFGGPEQYFRDGSNNAHFAGCGRVIGIPPDAQKGAEPQVIGVGFLECNHFETVAAYKKNALALCPPGYTPPLSTPSRTRLLLLFGVAPFVAALLLVAFLLSAF